MPFEKYALVRHVLVDYPEAFAIHGDDEAGADLAQRFQVRNFLRARKSAWRVGQGLGDSLDRRVGLRSSQRKIHRSARFEVEALRDGPVRRAAQFEIFGHCGARSEGSWNLGSRRPCDAATARTAAKSCASRRRREIRPTP